MSDPIQDIARQLGITTIGDGLLTKIRETIALLQSDANNLMQYKEVAAELEAELAALKAKAVIPEKARYALARRCLWIAYVWNDHNFRDAYEYAREEAESHGITSFDEANEWLEAQPQNNGVIVPRELLYRIKNVYAAGLTMDSEMDEIRALLGGEA